MFCRLAVATWPLHCHNPWQRAGGSAPAVAGLLVSYACPTALKTSRALIVTSCEVWPGCLCLLPLDLFVIRAGLCRITMCDQGPCFQLPSAPGVPCSPADGQLPDRALVNYCCAGAWSSCPVDRQRDGWPLGSAMKCYCCRASTLFSEEVCASCALTYACLAAHLPSMLPMVQEGSSR